MNNRIEHLGLEQCKDRPDFLPITDNRWDHLISFAADKTSGGILIALLRDDTMAWGFKGEADPTWAGLFGPAIDELKPLVDTGAICELMSWDVPEYIDRYVVVMSDNNLLTVAYRNRGLAIHLCNPEAN